MNQLTEQDYQEFKTLQKLIEDIEDNIFLINSIEIFIFILYALEVNFTMVINPNGLRLINIFNRYKNLERMTIIKNNNIISGDWFIKFNNFNGYGNIVQWIIQENTLILYMRKFIKDNNIKFGIQNEGIKLKVQKAIINQYASYRLEKTKPQ